MQGIVDGEPLIVVEHVTRIHPSCAPDWPMPPDGGDGAHKVIIEGRPRIEVNVEATDEGGNRAAGGNATAVGRLVNAIPWLRAAGPGLYDALDVPLQPAVGQAAEGTAAHERIETRHRRPRRQAPDHVRVGRDGARHRPGRRRVLPEGLRATPPSGLREFEAARLRIAQINGCLFCQDWRTEPRRRDGRGQASPHAVERRGAPPTRSTTAPAWPPSTPSGTRSTTTASTTSSGAG